MSDKDKGNSSNGVLLPSNSHLLHFLMDNTADRIYFKDLQSQFTVASKAMADFFGVKSRNDLIGKTDFDFFTDEHARPAFNDEQEIIRTGKAMDAKVEKETFSDGRVGWSLTTKMPLRDQSGKVIGTTGISKDITELKYMEDQLRQKTAQLADAERLQSTARLAAGLAHEIRNPLNNLSMAVEFLKNHPVTCEDPACVSVVDEMSTSIQRADSVIAELMESSGPGTLNLHEIPIEDLIDGALVGAEDQATPHGIVIHKQIAKDLPAVKVDRRKLERVISGVVFNSIQAMQRHGNITITASSDEKAVDEETRLPGSRAGERLKAGGKIVTITVEDDGPGIPLDTLARIFDPFFTTKETGLGAGLGLTVCRKLLELHHGAIEVANRDEGGVRVTIDLKV